MANLKLFGAVFGLAVVFLVVFSAAATRYVDAKIEAGIESELVERALQTQNEAVRENELLKEQIKEHNETQNKRIDAISNKYSASLRALSLKYDNTQTKITACEVELNAIKELLGVFYEGK